MDKIKVDLVMWTYNSEKNLPAVIKRIEEVIPPQVINRKIITDDNSKDKTREIAKSFGLEVHMNNGKGLNDNTKTAISLVTAPYFCSFEHDIILARDWWTKISKFMDDPTVVVAQGTRVSTNPAFRVIDSYGNQRTDYPRESLDNNMGKTELIQKIGYNEIGTPIKLRAQELKWFVDRTVVSDHIRPDMWDNIQHDYKMQALFPTTPKERLRCFRILLTSPIRSAHMVYKTRYPVMLFIYPIDRFAIFLGALKKPLASNKK
jgi:glycosyltransferase involved in cell wall biosynthesis